MVEIVSPTDEHLRYIAHNMRDRDVKEVRSVHGPLVDIEYLLRGCVKYSEESHVALLDGVPFCVFGLKQNPKAEWMGIVWMLATDKMSDIGVMRTIGRLSEIYIESWFEQYDTLMNFVSVENDISVKWLKRLGFDFHDPIVFGSDRSLFYPFCKVRSLKSVDLLDTEERSNLCTSTE